MLSKKLAIAACSLAVGSISTGLASPQAHQTTVLTGIPRNTELEQLATRYNPAIRPVIIDYSNSKSRTVTFKEQEILSNWLKREGLSSLASAAVIQSVKDTVQNRDFHTIDDLKVAGTAPLRISIFGPSRSKDARYLAYELGLRDQGSFSRLSAKANPDSLAFIFKLHEVGHIIDPKHPHLPGRGIQSLAIDHQAEMFSDVFATLVCLKEFPQHSKSIDFFRLTRQTSPYFTSEPTTPEIFNTSPLNKSVKYFTASAIDSALEQSKLSVKDMSPQRLVLLALSITDTKAYSGVALQKISMQLDKHHRAVGRLDTVRFNGNSYSSFTFTVPEFQRIPYAQSHSLLPLGKVGQDLVAAQRRLFPGR